MNRITTGIAALLLTVFTMTVFPPRALPGSGIITDKGNGRAVNLTVYFDDKGQDQQKWITNFQETHKLLWTATRGLLRLGEIRLGLDPSVKGRADIRIDKIGHASVSQPDDRERTSLGTGDVLYLFEEDMKHPIITVHELGHYLFCLSDEYKSDVWAITDGVAQIVDSGNEESSWCSVERASPRESTVNPNHSCVMYDNDTPKIYSMFCAEEHLKRNDFPDGRWAVTRQQRDNKMSCLHTIAASLGVTTLPGVQTGDPPDAPSIVTLKPEKRVGILIQADLTGTALQKARNVAVETVKRLRLPGAGRNGDSVGVATFAASLGVIQEWKTLNTQSDIDGVVNGITGIQTTAGPADLETALRAEMTAIIGGGYRYATQSILLFTNASGTVSQALIDELRRNDVVVDVISDNSALKGLAVQTGGDFTYMNSLSNSGSASLALRAALEDGGEDEEESDGSAAAAVTDGYLIARFAGIFPASQPVDLPVDELNDGITIDFSSSSGPITLILKDPAGATVDLDNPPDNVQVQRTASRVLVRVGEPDPGSWTAQVDGAAAVAYTLELSGSGDAMGEADLPSQSVIFPAATRLYLTVENGMIVTGCQVQAVVTRPDRTKITVPLYDDGNLALHGDAQADDGVYTALFTPYTGPGVYRVEFQIHNNTGQYSTAYAGVDALPDDLTPGPVGPAPPFQRMLYDSFSVEGVPAAGGTALLAPGNLTLRSEAGGQVTLSWIDTNEGLSQTVVQRDSGGGYQTIAVVEAGQILYTDAAAGTNGQLSYRLLARTAAGDSQTGRPGEIDAERAAAALSAKRLTVTKSGTGSGIVTASPGNLGWSGAIGSGMVDLGTVVSLSAVPDANSVFTGWSGEGCSGAASCNVTMDAARSVAASFRNILKGDIDDNLTVNLADAVLAMRIASGVISSGTVRRQADANGDRKIGSADALFILQFVAGMRPDYQVLARVEVPGYLEDLNLDVYADLEDAAGTYYALVIATKRQLDDAGVTYRIIDEYLPGTSYLIALADAEGARKEAAGLVDVLYDDGEHIIVRYKSALSELLPDIGFDLKLMSQTPIVYNPVAPGAMGKSPLSTVSFPIVKNAKVETMLTKVTDADIKLSTEQLSGEKEVLVDETLEKISSRHTYRQGTKVQQATQYVHDRLKAMGLTPSFADWTVEYGEEPLSNRNVVGEIRGQSAPEEIVLLIAHLDTISKALDGIEPGADDNASGCVALLTAADIMRANRFKRTVRFVFTTGEEQSLYGGTAYAKKMDDERQKVVAVLNLDMIGYSKATDPPVRPKQQIKIRNAKNRTGNAKDLPIAQAYIDVVKTYGMDQVFEAVIEDDGEVTSDHAPFWDLMADCMKRDPLAPCYPAAWIIEYAEEGFLNPKMHSRNDRVNIMNLPYYAAVVKAALGTAAHLAEIMD
jgi:hypothetical protein